MSRRTRLPWWRTRNVFLRSIGFEFPFICGIGRGSGEEPKVVISTDSKLALRRCGIHILPVLVSITVLILNLGNSYLGRGLPGSIIDPSINIALLQVAAKIQELLMVASVTMVVMHVLRSELVNGEGLPLGLVGGGFLYTTMSYFWSPEFWGSTYIKYSRSARCRVYGIIVIGGLVAAFAGPSTAVLLVPREQPWPAGGTDIYLPGPQNHSWPTTIGMNEIGPAELCQSSESKSRALCPNGGQSALWAARHDIDILHKKTFLENTTLSLTSGFSFGPSTIHLPSNLGLSPNLRYHGNHRGYACETSMLGPRLSEAMYQAQIRQDWIDEAFSIPSQFYRYGPSLVQYKYFGSMQVHSRSRIPAVRTACTPAQKLHMPARDLLFPRLPSDTCWTTNNTSMLHNVTLLSQAPLSYTRTSWISLPPEFGSTSGGLLIELPYTNEDTSRAVIGCSFDARWTDGNIITYHVEDMSGIEKLAAQVVFSTALLVKPREASQWVPGYSDFGPVIENQASERVHLETSWLDHLSIVDSFETQGIPERNASILENMITDLGFVSPNLSTLAGSDFTWNIETPGKVNRTVALEWWLALLLTSGLSRIGSAELINTTGLVTDWKLLNYDKAPAFRNHLFSNQPALRIPENISTMRQRVNITIDGFSFLASSLTDFAAAGLLLIHILMALAHTLYTVWWTGRSSNSWDSLTELLVLMQNSKTASDVLPNTNAGIVDLETYSRRARVVATSSFLPPQSVEKDLSKVEMIFEGTESTWRGSTQSSINACNESLQVPEIDTERPQELVHSNQERRRGSAGSVDARSPLLFDRDFVDLNLMGTSQVNLRERRRTGYQSEAGFLEKILTNTKYR